MKLYCATLLCLLNFQLAVAGESAVDSFFACIRKYHTFASSTQVVQYSQYDTAISQGYVAWSGNKFFAHLGDEFFLQRENGELVGWTEGTDAMLIQNQFPMGNWKEMRNKMEQYFSLSASLSAEKSILLGITSGEDASIKKFEMELDSTGAIRRFSMWDAVDAKTDILFKKPLKNPPNDSLFHLPAGVSIVR